MSGPHLRRDRSPGVIELVLDVVKARFVSIVAVLAAIGAVVAITGLDLSIPRSVRVFGLAVLFIAPYGYVFGQYLTSLLWSPEYVYLVDLDARYTDGALYQLPFEDFRELEVEDGELDQLAQTLYVGRDVDLEDRSVTGVWRGTLSDRELMLSLSKIDECRGQLESDAKRGFALQTQIFTIVRNCVRSGVLHVVRTFEEQTLPDRGEGINTEIESALDRFDLDTRIEEEIGGLNAVDSETIEAFEAVPGEPPRTTQDAGEPSEVIADDD